MSLTPSPHQRTEFPEQERREALRRKLVACHGSERAARIMAGQGAEAKADEAAWRNLGKRTPSCAT